MTSRLDRLFVLLESGTSAVTRRAAARQLGEVQRAHPHELHRLLARVTTYLRSPAWETRVAASQAVEAILANIPEWNPPPCLVIKDDKEEAESSGQLTCATFDMERVLRHGAHLMGSEGNEYDLEEELPVGSDLKEKIARQRQQLNARLGLDVASKLGMDLSDVYTNKDLMCSSRQNVQPKNEPARRPVAELMPVPSGGKLSSREMNRARRKARQALFSKQKSRDASADEGSSSAPPTPTRADDEPDKKKMKMELCDDVFFTDECVPQLDGTWGATCTRWPLESWACAVSAGLFSASWEARHGAASALRELLRAPIVAGSGKQINATKEQMEECHQDWLEDMSLRLLCVLALDRFGDFVSDQVVAPVRETCAQALGVALSRLVAERVCGVASLLARLSHQAQWEARHGALLGFKYLIAAREELACPTGAFEHLIAGLSDPVEDVGAVAAGALAPAAAAFLRARPDALRPVVARLWELLRDQDDLAAACNSYMALLAALISLPAAAPLLHPIPLTQVIPRLWPYLDHSTSSVRKATLQTLRTLTRPLFVTPLMSNGQYRDTGHNMDTNSHDGSIMATNTNETQSLAPMNFDGPNLAINTDDTLSLTSTNNNGPSLATNTNETQRLNPMNIDALNLATNTDDTQSLTPTNNNGPSLATNTNETQRLNPMNIDALNLATNTDDTQSLTPTNNNGPSLATNTNETQRLNPMNIDAPNLATNTDDTQSLIPTNNNGPSLASNTNDTQRLNPTNNDGLSLAAKTNDLQSLAPGNNDGQDLAPMNNVGQSLAPISKDRQSLGTKTNDGQCLTTINNDKPNDDTEKCEGDDIATNSNVGQSVASNRTDVENSQSNGNAVNDYMQWTPELLQDAMRHVYQRVLFEHVFEIQEVAEQVWENLLQYAQLKTVLLAACPVLSTWLCLAMQPARAPVDPALLLQPPQLKERRHRPLAHPDGAGPAEVVRLAQNWFIGGSESTQQSLRDRNVTRARCVAARMLGLLSCYIVLPAPDIEYQPGDESPVDCYVKVLVVYLRSGSALQRLLVGLVICAWAQRSLRRNPALTAGGARADRDSCTYVPANSSALSAPELLTQTLHSALMQNIYYDEVAQNCTRILQEVRDLVSMMRHYQLSVEGDEFNNILRLEQVMHAAALMQPMIASMKLKRVAPSLEERRQNLQTAAAQTSTEHNTYNVQVQAALAGACVCLHSLPERLNPVVKPLMESLKKEPHEELQTISAEALAVLLEQCAERQPSPNAKVLLNLKTFLRCDPEFTPRVALDGPEDALNADSGSNESGTESSKNTSQGNYRMDRQHGILTLWEQQRTAERTTFRRSTSAAGRPVGRPPTTDIPLDQLFPQVDDAQKLLRVQRRGATLALTRLAHYFADQLPHRLPKLWEFITEPFAQVMTTKDLESQGQAEAEELISCLQVLEAVCGRVGAGLRGRLLAGARAVARLTRHHYTAVRHMAARCLAALAVQRPPDLMQLYINEVVPALGAVGNERVRCGAAEALARVVDALQLQIVPYIVLLVVPLLGRMSDHCEPVRLMSTQCFASLIQLMPLDGAVPEPEGLSDELRQRKLHDKQFLDQLFNPKSIKDYKIPIPVSTELRSYQQAGVNWLRFLNEYKLHGVLCDDMGLGKTLQSIVVVAGDHWERCRRYAASRAPDLAPLPSLVVCPPTLTGHWVYEVTKFIPRKYLSPLQYAGPPAEREKLRAQVKHHNLIVASYDIVRKDIHFFSSIKWNYCVLDEGHIIKNGKTKAFKAIKMLVANHRLILSGTPIQNNVLELWSLFDFLMPGLLGTERQFTARYSRPILQARDARAAAHHQQAGALAMEALHRQVLPFLLRRVKEDVLKELPPKITQDYYCELSPLQRRLYEDFSETHMPNGLTVETNHAHVFQALRYLQNVCNHPKLVLTEEHPQYGEVRQQLAAQQSSLNEIEHSAKLPALKQLLQDCGIGAAQTDNTASSVLSQHRALIFCQLKSMLDIVERDLLRSHMPGVSYLRLDGAVPPGARHQLVQRFNNDPSIDVLLLTTKVGGLGLNLTGADTVIFVEHDWNPMKDLQAMDRAHRIGQRRVVNVYRLITRNTLEEKIMGLQKFKLLAANTVISSENASIETMGTEQLLDLFHLSNDSPAAGCSGAPGASARSVIETLPDLWDDKQYEEEYDMTNFIQSLTKTNK